jgi:predicted DCC family thiol-disulfide oxidoreductase YuxK
MEKLTVLYDSSCGFCVSCRRWLESQPTYFPLEFVPARTAAAARLLPSLAEPEASDELVVVSDDGAIYRGAQAWIVCLYALPEYREWSERLSSPALLPLARQAFGLLSRNRKEISARLHLLPEAELAVTLRREGSPACRRDASPPEFQRSAPTATLRTALLAILLVVLALLLMVRTPRLELPLGYGRHGVELTQPQTTFPKEVPMDYILWTYASYLAISIGLTIWVARTLHKNGRVFLVDSFAGNEKLADSVNHLLVVGFYLINIGYVSLALKETQKPADAPTSLELLSSKIGLVLLVLGAMHFFNLYVFSRMRRRALLRHMPPPVPAQGNVATPPRPPAQTTLGVAGAKA